MFWFDRNIENGGRETGRGNYGYEDDRVNGHSYPSETPMVTFKNTSPAETPGIAINDSSVTQVGLKSFEVPVRRPCFRKLYFLAVISFDSIKWTCYYLL